MTTRPLPPTHLLTIDQYVALGEDEHGRTELQEGSIVMSPSPTPNHNVAALSLAMQLMPQLPAHLEVILAIDVDLQLVRADQPGTSRRPDLVVVERSARRRVSGTGGLIRASDVRLVVEIVSDGSRRMDNIVKRAEYADAGIPHYWIIDLDGPVSLASCHLAEAFGYSDGGEVTTEFRTSEPFDIRVTLDDLY